MQMFQFALAGFAVILLTSVLRGTDLYTDFCVGAAIPVCMLLLGLLSVATTAVSPVTVDTALRHLDLALGLDGFALTRWLVGVGLYRFVPPVYASLPLALALAWALERSRTLLRSAVIGAVAALPLYFLVPAVGPQYAFSGFPSPMATPAVPGFHPRNCFPSMHLSWALLIALNARGRIWRMVAIVYAGLTAVVTVASGEHYFIDLIVAIPFTFAVQAVAERWSRPQSECVVNYNVKRGPRQA